MTRKKCLFFPIGFFYILSGCQRNQNRSRISDGHSIRSWFSRTTQKNSSSRLAEKETDWLIFQCRIEQTSEKAATKVINKKLYWGINIQRTYNKKIMRLSLGVESFDYDMAIQCKDFEILWSFAIFSRVAII